MLTLLFWRRGVARWQKRPPTSFSTVNSTNGGINPQNILTFSFEPFFHTGVKFHVCTQWQPQIIELEPRPPLKKVVFLVKSL